MQNQIALYLIFVTGVTLIYAAITGWELILGSKEDNKVREEESKEELKKSKLPFLTYVLHHIIFGFFKIFRFKFLFSASADSPESPVTNHYYRNKRIFFGFLGVIIILLGIFALNSGKFS